MTVPFTSPITVSWTISAANDAGQDSITAAQTRTSDIADLVVVSRGTVVTVADSGDFANSSGSQKTHAITGSFSSVAYTGELGGADDVTATAVGVEGRASQTPTVAGAGAKSVTTYGGAFFATGNTNGTSVAYGVYATASGADTNWAGYFAGNVSISGALTVGSFAAVDVDGKVVTHASGAATSKFVKGEILGSSYVATDQTTSSGTPVDLTTTQHITFTLEADMDVLITCTATAYNTTAAVLAAIVADVNGSDTTLVNYELKGANAQAGLVGSMKASLSAGSNTIKLQFATTGTNTHFLMRCIKVERA